MNNMQSLEKQLIKMFSDIDMNKQPEKYLDILDKEEARELAKKLEEENKFHKLAEMINDLAIVINKKKSSYKQPKKEKNNFDDEDQANYANSDVLYWEAVHEGEINPDESYNSSSYDFDGFDYLDDRAYISKETKKVLDYSNPSIYIKQSLDFYIISIAEANELDISREKKIVFLNNISKLDLLEASIQKRSLEQIFEFGETKEKIQRLVDSHDYLEVDFNGTSAEIFNKNRKVRYELHCFQTLSNLDDEYNSNELSMNYVEYGEDGNDFKVTTEDLELDKEILEATGIGVGDDYVGELELFFDKKIESIDSYEKFYLSKGLYVKASLWGRGYRKFYGKHTRPGKKESLPVDKNENTPNNNSSDNGVVGEIAATALIGLGKLIRRILK